MSFPMGPSVSPPLVVINDIQVTQTQIITPAGIFPVQGAQWSLQDTTYTKQEIPQWAIICAILGFFLVCALSLLFLLAKEERTTGSVQVTVNTAAGSYTTMIPAGSRAVVMDLNNRVNYARTLSAGVY
ncbi:hypothetical protein [Gordonia liuliyuniae]|uniref:PEGA domain-containing protein n=1 Tax=Gordonia liuliyuniae TaxID=2911517 RepID=A0ABS9ISC6_9ACTN|nr:hypothetical protein [Gordonia liuliyuniae]MCF8588466.1 hypothetical protein [Gordonia liuliyuniae]